MKRIVLLTTVFVFSLLITKVFAQTPITTADVYKAYMDLEIVERALEKGNLDDDILKFLADKQNPIDEKMAVVNALFASSQAFSVEDSLAQKYVTYAHGKSLQEINKEDLLDYEWFVVGYLDAMQNYQNLSVSKAFMENALLLNQDSLVVNLIHTLYTTQYKLTNQNLQGKDIFNYWNESIKSIGTNIKNETTRFDIRPKALEYYFRYMIMPDNTIFNLELDSPFLMLESEKSSKIKVYGGVRPFNVEVLSGDADIVFDGVNLKIEGKTKGQTDYMLTDRNGLSVRGSIYVKGTNDELYEDIFVEFLLDSEFFLINGEEKEIDSLNPTKPFLNEDGRTLIPIRAFIESIGGIVGWDAENRKVIVTLNGNTLDLFLDQRLAYFNGEEFKMDTEATIVNNRAMVSLRVVSEKLGFDVEWMETERSINIQASSRIQHLDHLQLNGNHINYGYVTNNDEFLFYLNKNEEEYNIVKENKANGELDVIFEGFANYLNLHDEYLYFKDNNSKIQRVNIHENISEIFMENPINEFFIVDEKLIFTAGVINENDINEFEITDFNTLLYSLDLSNPNDEPSLLYTRDVWDLNTDGKYLYFRHLMQTQSKQGIYRISLDGNQLTKVTSDFAYLYVLRDFDIFYLDSNRRIKKISLVDGESQQIINDEVYSFNVSNNHISYLSLDDSTIYITDLHGRDKRKVRGVPERTIVDLNFVENLLFVFFDFSASNTSARMNDFVFDLNKLYSVEPESEMFYLNDDIISKMLDEQLEKPVEGEKIATMETSMGKIKMRLFEKEAPLAVENFITLASEGYFDGMKFHMIFDDFLIQTGAPKADGTGGESIWGEVFQDELHPGRLNFRGAVSMANMGRNTNTSQFFIVQKPLIEDFLTEQMGKLGYENYVIEKYSQIGGAPWLDGMHTVFGQVFKGLDVVDEIAGVEMLDAEQGISKDDVIIKSIEVKEW